MARASSPKASLERAVARKARAKSASVPAGLAATLDALREEIASLSRDVARQTEAIARARLEEIPRAEDFQPLADHLYAFAETAPALLSGLEGVRRAVEVVETTARIGDRLATLLEGTIGYL